MSMMLCQECGAFVDTDFDPDSLYIMPDRCVCEACRGDREPDYKLYDKQAAIARKVAAKMRESHS